MGLTGIVLSARLRLRRVDSAYVFVDFHKAPNLEDALQTMDASDERYDYSVAWIDGLATGKIMGRSVLMRGNHAAAAELPARGSGIRSYSTPAAQLESLLDFPSGRLNRSDGKGVQCRLLRRSPHRAAATGELWKSSFIRSMPSISGTGCTVSAGLCNTRSHFRRRAAATGLRTILDRLARSGRASFLAVLKRFGDAGPGLLSFPFRGYTLALDIPVAEGWFPFFTNLIG